MHENLVCHRDLKPSNILCSVGNNNKYKKIKKIKIIIN